MRISSMMLTSRESRRRIFLLCVPELNLYCILTLVSLLIVNICSDVSHYLFLEFPSVVIVHMLPHDPEISKNRSSVVNDDEGKSLSDRCRCHFVRFYTWIECL